MRQSSPFPKGLRAFKCQLLEYAFPSAPPSITAYTPSSLAPTGQVTGVETSHTTVTKSMDQLPLYHTSLPQLYIGRDPPVTTSKPAKTGTSRYGAGNIESRTNLTLNSSGTKRVAEARGLPSAKSSETWRYRLLRQSGASKPFLCYVVTFYER